MDVDPKSTLAQEEVFGPVLAVIPFEDDDDAVRIANDSIYGLSGAVTSASEERALGVARRIRTGTLGINGAMWFAVDTPVRRLPPERRRARERHRGFRGVSRDQGHRSPAALKRAIMPEVASQPAASAPPLPRFAGALPLLGHMAKFARDPVAMMQQVRAACGPVGEFRMLNKRVVLLSGPAAQEAFCRAPDELLSQKIAYRMMTPVFGEGVVFDAPPERLNEQLRILMPALRDRNMRTYADIFTAEVGRHGGGLGRAGRDRPPRLHGRAHDLHVEPLPAWDPSSAAA